MKGSRAEKKAGANGRSKGRDSFLGHASVSTSVLRRHGAGGRPGTTVHNDACEGGTRDGIDRDDEKRIAVGTTIRAVPISGLAPIRERRVDKPVSVGLQIDGVDIGETDHRRPTPRQRRREARGHPSAVGAYAFDRAAERRRMDSAAHLLATSAIDARPIVCSAKIELPSSDEG